MGAHPAQRALGPGTAPRIKELTLLYSQQLEYMFSRTKANIDVHHSPLQIAALRFQT